MAVHIITIEKSNRTVTEKGIEFCLFKCWGELSFSVEWWKQKPHYTWFIPQGCYVPAKAFGNGMRWIEN